MEPTFPGETHAIVEAKVRAVDALGAPAESDGDVTRESAEGGADRKRAVPSGPAHDSPAHAQARDLGELHTPWGVMTQ